MDRDAHNAKKAQLVAYKGGKCFDCGKTFPLCCYDFDHRVPDEKSFQICGRLYRPLAELLMEIDKCDLVCANCHRIRTATNPAVGRKISKKMPRATHCPYGHEYDGKNKNGTIYCKRCHAKRERERRTRLGATELKVLRDAEKVRSKKRRERAKANGDTKVPTLSVHDIAAGRNALVM